MDFSKLSEYLDSLSNVGVPGCDLILWRDHSILYRHTAGFRDAVRTQAIDTDEVYWLFSATKVITTCAAMQLVEEGKMHLDDSVSTYLDAYGDLQVKGKKAQRTMTVRHLMSMQSGLDYNLDRKAVKAVLAENGNKVPTRTIVNAFVKDSLLFEPGTDFQYSLSHDVLAAVIEVVSGERFSDYLKTHIFDPLGLGTFSFRLTDTLRSRLCAPYMMENGTPKLCTPDWNNYCFSEEYESGGAGLIGNVYEYGLFLDALASGGKAKDGTQLLSPEMIQLWRANQLETQSRKSFDSLKRYGYSYALGVRTRVDNHVGGLGPIGEFGWDGAAGAYALIDPVNHISAFFAMHVRNFGYSYDVIHPTIRNLIYQGFDKGDVIC